MRQLDAALVRQDQDLLDRLNEQPISDAGLTDCCRLIMRYENTGRITGDLARQAQTQLETWGLTRRTAFRMARELWFNGYRPRTEATNIGSGADLDGG